MLLPYELTDKGPGPPQKHKGIFTDTYGCVCPLVFRCEHHTRTSNTPAPSLGVNIVYLVNTLKQAH